ncbi:MAG: Mov34/MPN/PAD-1 family protein [Polyangiaceae bacterium]|nr:Mov34/MPN/PAD-1 family protein [Polyangiaceae bacterium]
MHDIDKHPWILGGLVIHADILARVDEEAKAAYARDEESCGLLVGPFSGASDALLVDEIVPMENRANKLHALDPETYPRTGRMYFDINPLKFEREIRERAAAGRPAKVLYHSHVDAGAYFSPTDVEATTAGGDGPSYDLAYLVTSVQGGEVSERKLFVWDPERRVFAESKYSIV